MRKQVVMQEAKFANMATKEGVEKIASGYNNMKYNLERELELIQEHVKEVQDKNGETVRRMINLEK